MHVANAEAGFFVLVGRGASLLIPIALWYVLERVTDRTDVLIISMGGILYATVTESFLYLRAVYYRYSRELEKRIISVQIIVDDDAKSIGVGDRLKIRYREGPLSFMRT